MNLSMLTQLESNPGLHPLSDLASQFGSENAGGRVGEQADRQARGRKGNLQVSIVQTVFREVPSSPLVTHSGIP